MKPSDFTTEKLPDTARPFDYDIDLPLVLAYVAATENGMYSFSNMMGSQVGKSMGARMDYDVIKVQSLRDPEKVSIHLTTHLNILGHTMPTPPHNNIIAGVADGKLWFRAGDQFISDSDEIKLRNEMHSKLSDAIGGPLKSIFKDLEKTLEEMRRGPEDLEGEEWKNDN